jgi:anti-sigma B factor antagonist
MNRVNIARRALHDEVAVFAPAGELDAYTGPQLREDLGAALDEGVRWLVLDMARVEYIDSVGLGIIVGAAKRTAERAGNLAVVAARPNVLRVFEISGTRELLNVVATLDEAQARLDWPTGDNGADTPGPAGGEEQ